MGESLIKIISKLPCILRAFQTRKAARAKFGYFAEPSRGHNVIKVDLLSRQNKRERIHFSNFLLSVDLLILELSYHLHAIKHLFELVPRDFQWLKKGHIYLEQKINKNGFVRC